MATATAKLVLDDTMGAAYIGVIVASCLHGVSCVQAWYYYTHQDDAWPLRLIVGAVMLFDTIHQILISHTVYTYLISNYNNPIVLTQCVWSLLVEVLFNGFTAFLVQSFLAMRVWKLSNRNWWLTSLVMSLVLAEFGCVLTFGGISLMTVTTFADLASLQGLSIAVNALAAAGDVLIAVTLCTLLHLSRTGFQKSETMINKLIIFAVNTGLLTSLTAVGSLISILVAPNTFIYILFFFCIGRLYTNSLLATLNARKMIRTAAEGVNSTSDKFSFSLKEFPKGTHGNSSKRHQANISIKIDTTHEFSADLDHEKRLALARHSRSDVKSPHRSQICSVTGMHIEDLDLDLDRDDASVVIDTKDLDIGGGSNAGGRGRSDSDGSSQTMALDQSQRDFIHMV